MRMNPVCYAPYSFVNNDAEMRTPMAKSSPSKKAAQYESNTLAAFAVAGIVLIALGIVSLLAIVGGMKGGFFSLIRRVMQGLGGGLCIGISILLLWLGVLMVFSSGRHMPKRGFLLVTLMFLAVLGIINLLSRVGTYYLMDYLVAASKAANPPVPTPDGFVQMLRAVYALCAGSGAFGGAAGMLLAWPAWTFLGSTLGTVALGLICVLCVLFVSRFDLMQMVETIREGLNQRSKRREQEHAQEAYMQQRALQERQAQEAQRAAFARQQAVQTRQEAAQPVYPPYGSMLGNEPYPASQQPPPAPQGDMYDELIIPQGQPFTWRKSAKKADKPAASADPYQTRMTFTPSEMGVGQEPPSKEPMIVSASKRRAMERIEAIRKRKADLHEEMEGNEMAREAQTMSAFAPPQTPTFAPEVVQAVQPAAPVSPPDADEKSPHFEPAVFEPPVYDEPIAQEPAAYQEQRDAFYKRPASEPAAATAAPPAPKPQAPAYVYPSIDLLNAQQRRETVDTRAADTADATRLEKTLESFGIPARVQRVTHGPAVTRFELGLVSSGINVKRIMGIADNIALDMAANGGVRIEIPIPGTNLFGVEVPNKEIQSVTLAEVLMSDEMRSAKSPLAVALGRDIAGKPVICDIAKMPHLLIAGQTGSGKSVCINAIVNSLLFRTSPEEVRMIMIDPKVVELQCYNVVPHLLIPVVSDPHKAAGALQWAVAEMLDRYHKMQSKNVREISAYNAKLGPEEEKLPRIVIIIDELADLMLACKKEVEESIIRIAQLARAAGIHMIVATQRPTVDVITGLIKANIPSRIAFAVSSSIDSRTILDQNGAEKLLGRGDMFYFPTGAGSPIRVQGCFLSDAETERVVNYIGAHSSVEFDPNVIEAMESDDEASSPLNERDEEGGVDDRLAEAIEMVITDGQASISMLQRRMKIGYARAGRLIDDMAARGIVSRAAGSKPREVLMSREEFESMKDKLLQ